MLGAEWPELPGTQHESDFTRMPETVHAATLEGNTWRCGIWLRR